MLRLNPKGPDLWDSLIPEEARALPEELAHVDELLRDARFMAPFTRRFNEGTGKPGVPVATYLRLMYLRRKHRLGYDALVEQVGASIPWRTFCGIGCRDRVPAPSTLSRLTQKYGEETLHELYCLVSDDLAEWKILRRRILTADAARRDRSSPRHSSNGLVRRLARLPAVGPLFSRLVERARSAMADEARALAPDLRPSVSRERGVNARLLDMVRETIEKARRLTARVRDRRVQREVQMALDLGGDAGSDGGAGGR